MQSDQPRHQLAGFDPRTIFENSPSFREGEGEFIIGGDFREVLGRMAACFLRFYTQEGQRCFHGILVIAPPRLVWDYSDEDINSMLLKGLEDVNGKPLSVENAARFLQLVTVHRCQQLDTNEVVNTIATSSDKQIILIAESSKFRDPTLKQDWELGRSGTLLPEEIWVPHASRLAAACLLAAKSHSSVVVFSAIELAPAKDESIQQLNDVELLFPIILGSEDEPDLSELFSTQAPRWFALAAGGLEQQAFEELENAGVEETVKTQIAMQLWARAGNSEKVRELLLDRLVDHEKLSAEDLARLGRMAHMHGAPDTAKQFFSTAVNDLTEQMWLEVALLTLTSLSENSLVERSWERLHTLFPQSLTLQENRAYRLMVMCDATQSDDAVPPSSAGFEDVHNYLADALRPGTDINYVNINEKVLLNWPTEASLAAICMALHALRQQDLSSALHFAIMAAEHTIYELHAVRVLLGTLRRMLLLEVRPTEGMDSYKTALRFILQYLGRHPEESSIRDGLSSALSVEMAGGIGLPMLASFAFDVSALGTHLDNAPSNPHAASPEEFAYFFAQCIDWMGQQTVIELGVTRLPAEIVGSDAGRFIVPLTYIIQEGVRNQEAPDDLEFLEKCAYILGLLHPHAPEYSADLEGLRLFAARLSLSGQPQRARNTAEEMLFQGKRPAKSPS
jgi:hypothetical protein